VKRDERSGEREAEGLERVAWSVRGGGIESGGRVKLAENFFREFCC